MASAKHYDWMSKRPRALGRYQRDELSLEEIDTPRHHSPMGQDDQRPKFHHLSGAE
ncbi:hypothetical protein EMIT0P201_12266 [Pseudomonas chlororaphis]